jgi:hypothetical protein
MKNPFIPWMNILTITNAKFTFGQTFSNWHYNCGYITWRRFFNFNFVMHWTFLQ